MTAPRSQTAPVAEFRCLYTPDVRKKQKKWQDGFLKFHAFNNRVMVYDHARNFLGDTYYKDSNELHEGDELTLDKGVMVEVADALGVSQTDLTPLFEKRPTDRPLDRRPNDHHHVPVPVPPPPTAPPRRFQPPSQVAHPSIARPHVAPHALSAPHAVPLSNTTSAARATPQQLRHKSLNTLLGTPKGPIGKSVPIKSPYEARQEKERENENDFAVDRAAKRQKTAHISTTPATLRLSSPVEGSPAPKKHPPSRKNIPVEDHLPAKINLPAKKDTPHLATAPVPTTSRRHTHAIPPEAQVIALDDLDAFAHISSDASLPSTPPITDSTTTIPAPHTKSAAIAPAPQTPRIPRGKVPVPSVKALETPQPPAPASSPPVSASNRLTNVDFAIQPTPAGETVKRPAQRPVEAPPSPPRHPKARSLRLSRGVKRGTLMMCQPLPPRSRVGDEALAPKAKRKVRADDDGADRVVKSRQRSSVEQQLRTPPSPGGSAPILGSPEPADSRNFQSATSLQANEATSARTVAPPAQTSAALQPRPISINKMRPKPKSVNKVQPTPASPPTTTPQAVQSDNRKVSPALSVLSEPRSRTTSLSPRKLATLSTGGFRKRVKRATPQTSPAPEISTAVPRNETVALPPHPLRANKKGPVMTTTELAAMLQKPKRKAKPADPIEEAADAAKSPNRKFRRVRSENDAPIPSTSEAWEKRNLPQLSTTATTTATEAGTPAVAARKKSGLAALIHKTDPRKKFMRTQSLTVQTATELAQHVDSPAASPTVDTDVGPWSVDAFDLFDWRPPRGGGRDGTGT